MIPTVETTRLRLRPWREGDLEPYLGLTSDPEVMRYLGYGETADREAAWRQIALFIGHWHLRGFGFWAVDEKASGEFVGRVGLWQPAGWPGIEVGWALARRHWGKGFASEAALATLEWGFRRLGPPQIVSLIYRENVRSIRVAERIGERYQRTIVKFRRECLLYGIERENFLAAA
jgi:RimJ/RimL family protein N-acetyltransferase